MVTIRFNTQKLDSQNVGAKTSPFTRGSMRVSIRVCWEVCGHFGVFGLRSRASSWWPRNEWYSRVNATLT